VIADEHTERAVLGGLLLAPAAWPEVADRVTPEDFHSDSLRAVATALWSLLSRGTDVDLASLASELEGAERLRMVGGMAALSELHACGVSSATLRRHAVRLRDVAAARRLESAALDVRSSVDEALADPIAWVEQHAGRLTEAARLQREDGARSIRDMLHPALVRLQRRKSGEEQSTPYGYADLDQTTGGMAPGEYVVLAARPSCGKSALAMNIAVNVAREGIPVRVQSMEMSGPQLLDRVFAQQGRVAHGSIRTGRVTESDMQGVISACSRLQNAPLWIDDSRGLTGSELCSRVRQWRRDPKAGGQHERAVVVVDYLQLVRPSKRCSSREQEVAEVSGALQTLAGQTGCSLLVLAQLSRAVEQRGKEAKPMLSDLRESGAIEQDADTVIFVHRPDRAGATEEIVPGKRVPVQPGTTELVIAKARNGETGFVKLHFVGRLVSFESVDHRQEYRT
jgi:replicative DNA helicase